MKTVLILCAIALVYFSLFCFIANLDHSNVPDKSKKFLVYALCIIAAISGFVCGFMSYILDEMDKTSYENVVVVEDNGTTEYYNKDDIVIIDKDKLEDFISW